jgi:hypothetical protein
LEVVAVAGVVAAGVVFWPKAATAPQDMIRTAEVRRKRIRTPQRGKRIVVEALKSACSSERNRTSNFVYRDVIGGLSRNDTVGKTKSAAQPKKG